MLIGIVVISTFVANSTPNSTTMLTDGQHSFKGISNKKTGWSNWTTSQVFSVTSLLSAGTGCAQLADSPLQHDVHRAYTNLNFLLRTIYFNYSVSDSYDLISDSWCTLLIWGKMYYHHTNSSPKVLCVLKPCRAVRFHLYFHFFNFQKYDFPLIWKCD